MRIVFIVHTFFPNWQAGTEVYARSLARKAILNGHEAFVVCYEPPTPDVEYFEDLKAWDCTCDGLPVHRISFFTTYGYFHVKEYFHPAVEEHLREYLSVLRPDIVHVVHSMHLSTAGIWAAKRLGLPVVATATDFWYVCPTYQLVRHNERLCRGPIPVSCLACVTAAPPKTRLHRLARWEALFRTISPVLLFLAELRCLPVAAAEVLIWTAVRPAWMKKTISHVDVLLAPTPNTARLLGENGLTAVEVRTSGFGLEQRPLAARPLRTDPAVRLGYVGTFRESKGVHVLLEAMRLLPNDRLRLDVYGKVGHFPEYDRRLFALAKDLDNVTFRGTFPNDNLGAVFADLDVLVIPALWYENSPLVLLSAFAQKVPVIASRIGSLADLIEHGKSGLLFKMGDPASLAAQLQRVLDDPECIPRLRAGIPEVKTVDENVAELFAIYEQLSSRYQSSRPVAPERPSYLPKLSLLCGSVSATIRLSRFGAKFENELTLLRCSIAAAGDHKLRFQFYWHSGAANAAWMVFVHFLDQHGRVRLQADHQLCRYNQDPWGFIAYTLDVASQPPDIGNTYSVQIGVWNPKTAIRLPVIYSRGLTIHPAKDAVLLGDVQVQ
jgi:glycosyltransferase involved in cell wall biosynthesis